MGLQDWFGGRLKREVREEIMGLGEATERTLTVLSVVDSVEEKEEDEDLEEAPPFRR